MDRLLTAHQSRDLATILLRHMWGCMLAWTGRHCVHQSQKFIGQQKGGSIESCCGLISEDLIIITTDDRELLVRGQWQRGRTEIATMNHLFTTTESVEECSASARVQSTALVGFCCYWLANDQFSGLVLCCCMKKFNNAICKIKCIQSSDFGDRQRYITLNGQQLGIGGYYVNMFPN